MRCHSLVSSLWQQVSSCTTAVLLIIGLVILSSGDQPADAGIFDTPISNGTDGALIIMTPGTYDFFPGNPQLFPTPVDPEGDNIYHFTSITIGAGVTVRLTAQHVNGPVFWLASGPIQIDADGVIDLNGTNGQNSTEYINCGVRVPAVAGAGGYPGGVGRCGNLLAQSGSGPGGGKVVDGFPAVGNAGHATAGQSDPQVAGSAYGNDFLVPLIGGSGGAGGNRGSEFFGNGGGAGGGALLIASSTAITVNGTIRANGGNGGIGGVPSTSGGAAGSGGAIRLVAPSISGVGSLVANGGAGGGSAGRIRLEAFTLTGSVTAGHLRAAPFELFLPTAQPAIRVARIDGKPVPPNPTGSFTVPDVTLNNAAAVSFDIEARNIPLGVTAQVYVFSENGPDQTVDSTPLMGTIGASTATAPVVLPPGFSRGFVRAIWTP